MLRNDLPPHGDAGVFLPAIIGFMVFLAGIALAGGMALDNLLAHWRGGIEASLTVELPTVARESAAAASARRERALAVFAGQPGIESARLLTDEDKAKLLAPWLGASAAGLDLPLPDLIAVVASPDARLDLAALSDRLQAASPGAVIDDHGRFRQAIGAIARTARLAGSGLLLLIGLAAASTVVFVARAGLAAHRSVIEILHVIGAHDGYVAGQFQRHALVRAFIGGAIGALAAAAAFAAALRFLPGLGMASLTLRPLQWAALAALPIAAALLAMLTARYTVLRALRRMI